VIEKGRRETPKERLNGARMEDLRCSQIGIIAEGGKECEEGVEITVGSASVSSNEGLSIVSYVGDVDERIISVPQNVAQATVDSNWKLILPMHTLLEGKDDDEDLDLDELLDDNQEADDACEDAAISVTNANQNVAQEIAMNSPPDIPAKGNENDDGLDLDKLFNDNQKANDADEAAAKNDSDTICPNSAQTTATSNLNTTFPPDIPAKSDEDDDGLDLGLDELSNDNKKADDVEKAATKNDPDTISQNVVQTTAMSSLNTTSLSDIPTKGKKDDDDGLDLDLDLDLDELMDDNQKADTCSSLNTTSPPDIPVKGNEDDGGLDSDKSLDDYQKDGTEIAATINGFDTSQHTAQTTTICSSNKILTPVVSTKGKEDDKSYGNDEDLEVSGLLITNNREDESDHSRAEEEGVDLIVNLKDMSPSQSQEQEHNNTVETPGSTFDKALMAVPIMQDEDDHYNIHLDALLDGEHDEAGDATANYNVGVSHDDKEDFHSDVLLNNHNKADKTDAHANRDDERILDSDTQVDHDYETDTFNDDTDANQPQELKRNNPIESPKIAFENKANSNNDIDVNQSQEQEQNNTVEAPKISFNQETLVQVVAEGEEDDDNQDLYALLNNNHDADAAYRAVDNDYIKNNNEETKTLESQSQEQTRNETYETPKIASEEEHMALVMKDKKINDDDLNLDALLNDDHETDVFKKAATNNGTEDNLRDKKAFDPIVTFDSRGELFSNDKDRDVTKDSNKIDTDEKEQVDINTEGFPVTTENKAASELGKLFHGEDNDTNTKEQVDIDTEGFPMTKEDSTALELDVLWDEENNDVNTKEQEQVDIGNEKELSPELDFPMTTEDNTALELDVLLDEENNDVNTKDQEQVDIGNEKELSPELGFPVTTEDNTALELDALLDEENNDVNTKEQDPVDISNEIELSPELDFSVTTEDNTALELDALLDEENNSTNVLEQVDTGTEKESSPNLGFPMITEDKLALELDALLDGEGNGIELDFEVAEDNPTNQTWSNLTQKAVTATHTIVEAGNGDSKIVNNICRALFESPQKIREAAANINCQKNITAESERKMPQKQLMEELFDRNSSSISASLSQSKKKIASTRDMMREYSRDLTKRASDRIKKNTTSMTKGIDQKVGLTSPPFVSSMANRSFMASTFSSAKKFGGKVAEEVKEKKPKPWGYNKNKRGFVNYMKSTIAFSNKVSETQSIEHQKAELKKINAQKIAPWRNKKKPTPTRIVCDDDVKGIVSPIQSPAFSHRSQHASPIIVGTISSITKAATTKLFQKQKAEERKSEDKRCIVDLSPRGGIREKTARLFHNSPSRAVTGAYYASPGMSITEKSIGSVSSRCTIESFVSPTRKGVLSCRKKYDPFLHKSRDACELCVFRLPESEREKLDARGRHLMVQFTTGGCQDCNVFSKSVGEPHIRLCNKCHSASHRAIGTRHRKRGDATFIGSSFINIPEGGI